MISAIYEGNNNSIDLINTPNLIIAGFDGLNQPTAEIICFQNPNLRGSQYHKSIIQDRQISFTFYVYNVESTKYKLIEVFKTGEKGILKLKSNRREGQIECYLEDIIWDKFQMLTTCQIILRAPYPYFEGLIDIVTELTNVISSFELEAYIPEEGIVLGEIINEHKGTIINDGDISSGITIEITAIGEVINPKIYNLTTNKFIGVNMTLSTDDKLIISTSVGKKKIYLEQNGIQTNKINKLAKNSSFFEIQRGENILQIIADSGGENMIVYIQYNNEYGEI